MTTIPEASERQEYARHSIDAALSVLKKPEIRQAIGSYAVRFSRLLSSAFITDISPEGEVCLPSGHEDDVNSLAVTAVMPEETITFSRQFDRQTDEQRRSSIAILEKWQPRTGTASQLYDDLITNVPLQQITYTLLPQTLALTGLASGIYSAEEVIASYFGRSPERGIVITARRPHLLLTVDPKRSGAPADFIGHELTHYMQWQAKPIESYGSQKSVDLKSLRLELEAYFVGANIAAYMRGYGSQPVTADNLTQSDIQIAVEAIRRNINRDSFDPFHPSYELFNQLTNLLGVDIIHSRLDYDTYAKMLGIDPN